MTTPIADDQAVLELDDPEWPMPQPHSSSGPVPRRLRVWRTPGGRRFAIITERGPGMSVTNVAGYAYAALAARWPGPGLRVFEHYPAGTGVSLEEHFDEITLDGRATRWQRVTNEWLVSVLGPGVLDDMPDLPPDPCDEATAARRAQAPCGPGVPDSTVFRGYPGRGGALVVLESADGEPLEPLRHYVKHSPDGFGWGGPGSGCAELARCLLIAVLGERARCHHCDGAGCDALNCEDGIALPPGIYQRFKRAHVAAWPAKSSWSITGGEIRAWLATQHVA
jgi:Family of unknown function (DUF6166)